MHTAAKKFVLLTLTAIAAALVGGSTASAATICVGAGTSCGTPDYALTEAGLQSALNEAASGSAGHDVIEIGPGVLDITTGGVASTPPVGETVAIQGAGSGATTINASMDFNLNPFTLNFQNVPTSTVSQMKIQVNANAGWFYTGLLMLNGGTVQSTTFDINSAAGAVYAVGLRMETSSTGYSTPPVCSACTFELSGPNAQGLRTQLYSGHAAKVNASWFERSGPTTDDVTGIVNVNSNTTTTVARTIFSQMTRGISVERGTVNVNDSFFFLGDVAGAEGVSVEYVVNNEGGRILNGNLDGTTLFGSGANQIGVDVHANTTNVLHEYGNTDISNSVFRLTGTGAVDVRCTQLNYGEATIGIQFSYVDGSTPLTSGTCATTLANNVDSSSTAPQFEDELAGDLRPAEGSPLIDAGDPTTDQTDRPTDVFGSTRFVTGDNGNSGGRIDMGALEYQGPPPDEEPPIITITSPTSGTNTTDSSVTLNFTATDNSGETPVCDKVTGSSQDLSYGQNTISVTCSDSVSNEATASVTVNRIDNLPPVVTITAPTNGSSTSAGTVAISYTATDNSGAAPNCDRINGSTQALSIGPNPITVNCTDAASNVGSATVIVNRLDVTPPIVTIISPTNGSTTVNSTADLVFSASDNSGGEIICDKTSGSAEPLAMGTNSIVVTCTDPSSNVGTGEVQVTRIDGTPPVVTITSPVNNFVTDTADVAVTFTAVDDSGQTPNCTHTSGDPVALAFGLNSITINCTDLSGNNGSASINVTRVSDAAPVVTIISPTDGTVTHDPTVVVNYSALDGLGQPANCNIEDGEAVPLFVGENTISVVCTDGSSNVGGASVTVTRLDNVPPTVQITAPTDGGSTSTGSTLLSFTATDNSGETPSCDKLNGSSVPLSVGENTITVNCTDGSDNVGSASVSITRLDVTAPVVTITSPADSSDTTADSVTVNYTAIDNSGQAPSCDIADGSSQPLDFGHNLISVVCTDAASNSGSASITVTRLDNTPPVVEITAPVDGLETHDTSVVVSFTATDDTGEAPNCDPVNDSSQSLYFGLNTITVECEDAIGNVGSATVNVTRIDEVAPVVSITNPVDGSTTTSDSTLIEFTATDNSGFDPSCDTTSGSTQSLDYYANTVTVSCQDATGNVGTASATITRLDEEAPVVTITAPTDGATTTDSTAVLEFSVTDNTGEVPTCDKTSGSSQALGFGENTLTVECTDASSNAGTASVTISRLDDTPPVVTITSPENGLNTNDESVVLEFTATDDGGGVPVCDEVSGSTHALSFGANVISVSCEDATGNLATASVTVNRYDNVPPVVTITSPTDGSDTTAASVALTFTASDNSGATPTCNKTSGSTELLSFGSNTITVQCTDGSSNTGSASATITRLDNTPPVINITAPTNGSDTTSASTTLVFTATDDTGVAPTCDKTSGSTEDLEFGSNTITVQCTDGSSNSASASVSVTRLDNTPPVVNITAPTNGSTTTADSVTLSFTATDDAGGTPTCDKTSGSTESLSFGSNIFTVQCTDGSDNTGSASVSVTRIDDVPPVVTITAPTDGSDTTDATAVLTFTATDNSGATPTCNKTSGSTEDLEFGSNTITVQCTDGSSNSTSASVSVTRLDNTPPVITITSPVNGSSTAAASVTLNFTATDDTGVAPSCDKTSGSIEDLEFGSNTITVQCTDGSDNVASASVGVTRLDQQPPVVTITAPVNGSSTTAASTILTFTAVDDTGATPTCNKTSGSTEDLEFGSNTITVQCTDGSSNTGSASATITRLDNTPPVVTITAPADSSTTTADSTILTFTAIDDTGVAPTCNKTSGSSQTLSFGSNTISVQCTDGSSNSASASVSVTRLDNTPPVINISSPTDGSTTTAASVTLSFTATDNAGGTPTCDKTSGSTESLSFGSNTFTVQCTDGSSNTSSASTTVTRLDNTPPVVNITSPVSGSTTTADSVTLNFTATDDAGGTPTCDKTSGSAEDLEFGSNTITVECTDGSDNTGSASVSVTRIDDVPPVVTITAPVNGSSTTNASVLLTFTAVDNSGATPTCTKTSGSTESLEFGSNTITVQCTDGSSNTGGASATITRLDNTPPVVTITAPADSSTTTADSTILTFTAIDDTGVAPNCNKTSGSSQALSFGSNTISVQCIDGSSNSATASVSVTRLDNTPPVVTITAPTDGSDTTAASTTLTFTAIDDTGVPPSCNKTSGSTESLAFGSNTITVQCTDDIGNTGSASVSVTRIDDVPPVVTITAPTDGIDTTDATAVLTFTATDNSGAAPTCDKTSGSTEDLEFGSNTITVQCTDGSSNSTSASVSVTRLDNTPPVITITSPVNGSTTTDESVTLNFTATDDSGVTPNCDKTSGSTESLSFGSNTITVECTDGTGNTSNASTTISRLDDSPPVVTITAPTDGSNTTADSTVVTFTATDDGGGTPVCDVTSGSTVPLSFGANVISVSCEDATGNIGASSVTVTRIDDVPPIVTITAPTDGSDTTAATAVLTFTATDNSGVAPTCDKTSGSSEALEFGSNTISVQCTDGSSNSASASVSVTRLDNTPPVINISSPTDGSTTTAASVTLSFTATDDAGGTPTCDKTSGSTESLSFGSNTFTVQCTDGSSNTSSASTTVTRLDNTPPVVNITSPVSGSTTTADSVTLNFTATDDAGGTPTCDKTSGSTEALEFGSNTITVECTDGSDNTGSASVSVTRIDDVPPVVTITAPADGSSTTASSVAVTFTATDNSGVAPSCSSTSGASHPLVVGANTITITCTDGSSNSTAASVGVTRVDLVAPVITITSPTNGITTVAPEIALVYTVVDDGDSSPTCNVSSGSLQPLTLGSNTLTVQCTDASSNTGSASVTITRATDPPPVLTISAPANGITTAASQTPLVFSATDNSGLAPDCDKVSGSMIALTPGANTITVTCTDNVGGVSIASVTITQFDETPPAISIVSPVHGSATASSVVVLQYSVADDSGEPASCTPANGTRVSLAVGVNTVTVSCTDASDNTSTKQAQAVYSPPPPPAQPTYVDPTLKFARKGTPKFKRTNKPFRFGVVGAKTRLTATVDGNLKVKLELYAVKKGFKSGRKCVSKKPRKRKRIKRCSLKLRGSRTLAATPGNWMLDWGGKWGRKKLPRGRYYVVATVRETGEKSKIKVILTK